MATEFPALAEVSAASAAEHKKLFIITHTENPRAQNEHEDFFRDTKNAPEKGASACRKASFSAKLT